MGPAHRPPNSLPAATLCHGRWLWQLCRGAIVCRRCIIFRCIICSCIHHRLVSHRCCIDDDRAVLAHRVARGQSAAAAVANETIDGHPTEKYRITITYQDQETQEGFIWNATDLDGMTIRSEVDNATVKMTSTLTNIVMGTPAADLFEVPMDYTETTNFLELVME